MNHPELYELEYLFECEAMNIEAKVPWIYSEVKFNLIRSNREIMVNIEIVSRCGHVELLIDKNRVIALELENIKDISITKSINSEGLIIEFDEDNYVLPFSIKTKPEINITWGTSLELQR
jgi:hypothetical protein